MKIRLLKPTIFTLATMCLCSVKIYAQSGTTTVSQDPKFEQMLNEKRRINSSITVNERYKIQVYSGDSETSKKTLSDFKRDFRNFDGTIVFSTPTYKVWVGNFKSRIEAERNLVDIKKKFPNSFLIKPNK